MFSYWLDYFLYFTVWIYLCYGIQLPEITEPDMDLIQPSTYINYVYFEDSKTWNEARVVCQGLGGDLAKVDSSTLRDHIVDIAAENYQTNIFSKDYWIGLVEPTENNHIWVSDCSTLNFGTNFPASWKDTEVCFRLKKDDHLGDRMKCNSHEGFLCQVQTDAPCSFITRLDSELLSLSNNLSTCQSRCSDNSNCWATAEFFPDSCIMLAPINHGSGNFRITTKFCLNVTRNETVVNVPDDSSEIPDYYCNVAGSSTTVSPTPSITIAPSSSASVSPSSSTFCSQLTVTETSTVISSYTDVVSVLRNITETMNVTQTIFNTEYISSALTNTEFLNITQTIYSTTSTIFTETSYLSTVTVTQTDNSNETSNYTTEEAQLIAEELVKNLTINSKTTGAHTRKLKSAEDKRSSSKYMGFVGIASIVIPLAILIFPDLRRILIHIRQHNSIYSRKTI